MARGSKDSLRARTIAFALLVAIAAAIGGTAGACWYIPLIGLERGHGVGSEVAMADTMPAMKWRFAIGAVVGGLAGAGLCTYAARRFDGSA